MFNLFTIGSGSNTNFLVNELCARGVKISNYPYVRGKHTREDTEVLISKFSVAQPDAFIFSKDEHLSRHILVRLKEVSPKTKFIMWYGDQRGYIVPNLIAGRKGLLSCLLITNTDKQQIRMYKDFGIPHVYTFYHSFSPSEFHPRDDIKVEYQTFFGGNNFKYGRFPLSDLRLSFISKVHRNFKNVVYGAGWPFKSHQAVPRNIYAEKLCTAHINLGINHYDVHGYYDRRLFECIASGKLHITYYIPGMEQDFVNHRSIVWFRNEKEGLEVIDHYLKNPEKRNKIANQGRAVLVKYHAWNSRAIAFIDIVKKIL